MQFLVHWVWQTQHHSRPHFEHSICMHPPSLSVGVRHLGQGLVDILMATYELRDSVPGPPTEAEENSMAGGLSEGS